MFVGRISLALASLIFICGFISSTNCNFIHSPNTPSVLEHSKQFSVSSISKLIFNHCLQDERCYYLQGIRIEVFFHTCFNFFPIFLDIIFSISTAKNTNEEAAPTKMNSFSVNASVLKMGCRNGI